MINSKIRVFFFITILFSSCQTDVRFINAQPEHLKELAIIPNKFHGIFVINKDTISVTDVTINGDTINTESLVAKTWGNYLFVNFLVKGVYNLACAKVVNSWKNENISLEYFDFLEGSEYLFQEKLFLEKIDEMIADKNNPLIAVDSTDDWHYILDNVNVNYFQFLLNNAESESVTRVE
jgi:hypothetical protein